ncbi:MAG: ATP-dependent DNA helicase RecG [Candidatus Bruticola sp.]
MEGARAYSAQAQDLAFRMLRLLRREYKDGCSGHIDIDAACQSFCRRTYELDESEALELRQTIKALTGYRTMVQRVRQSKLILTGKALAAIAAASPNSATSSPHSWHAATAKVNCVPEPADSLVFHSQDKSSEEQREMTQSEQNFLLVNSTKRLISTAPTDYTLTTPVEKIRGIGKAKQILFNNLGIYTLQDLLTNYPRRWENRSCIQPIANLRPGTFEQIRGVILKVKTVMLSRHRLIEAEITDGSGSVKLVWFNQPYLLSKIRPNTHIIAFGKAEYDRGCIMRLVSPEFALQSENSPSFERIVPIYRLSTKLYQSFMHKLMFRLVPKCASLMEDNLPPDLLKKYGFIEKNQAIMFMHWPQNYDQLWSAQQRLSFEELFFLQLRITHRRRTRCSLQRSVIYKNLSLIKTEFVKLLPFKLTGAQHRVIDEINSDLIQNHPMNRMLQGDVGSGKTVIAAYAALAAIKSGYQAAIMAPTELLAQQHYLKLCELLGPIGLKICLLKGSLSKKHKLQIAEQIKNGLFDLAVGTHALIQSSVEFAKLGLAVIDEQHKFGVMQRQALKQKSGVQTNCDVLLMTATPIPRTMSLTIYGDLELSKLDELPPGRLPIKSRCVPFQDANKAYKFVASQIDEGHQAYIVCPLINESDKLEVSAAVQEAERLKEGIFKNYQVGLLHGRMKAAEKENIMELFRLGSLDILISTTVIEVGVDVANATVILIQDANRFGMAQLHQLRGRIGRSHLQSYCLFLASSDCQSNRKLEAVARLADGFKVAEEDLEIRGPGDYFGTRQSGFPELLCADLLRDRHLLEWAKQEAAVYADSYPSEEEERAETNET